MPSTASTCTGYKGSAKLGQCGDGLCYIPTLLYWGEGGVGRGGVTAVNLTKERK